MPNTQAGVGTVLTNDGSCVLTWNIVTGITTTPEIAVVIVTGNITLTNTNCLVLADSTVPSFRITLDPTANVGKIIKIKDKGGNASVEMHRWKTS